ncbi:zona pellucida sperm-binding protein 1-like isoform X1 [Entelurus aequoreus]|uniref:zona pellucida sperm-binding protein 1-like isoform X1 n=1 Tax=Entelurus aequoreus TaxID=161455 RepID=UPI002B1DFC70|nr:zona pellucida sperm-binding protein 1-like isoform X1 [Entelurus aequoreus]
MNCNFAHFCFMLLLWSVARGLRAEKRRSRRQRLVLPRVSCSHRGIKAVFGSKVNNNPRVTDMSGATVSVPHHEGPCGVQVSGLNNPVVFSRYDSCYARVQGSKVVVSLQVQLTGEDGWFRVHVSCPLRGSSRVRTPPSPPVPGRCDVHKDLRVTCGQQRMSKASCSSRGCCLDSRDQSCYYKLTACSLDGHLVFSVKTDPPVDPRSLMVKDHPRCVPVIATADTAVFKVQVMDCGMKTKVIGDVVVYELEVEERSRNQSSPFRVQVECDYQAADAVNFPTNPPPVVAVGSIRVQMRIATDATFTSFFPEDQLPLSLPLREAAYVEVSIASPSPDPALSLQVRDCFAYPASRHSVWTLLYNGCPNPLDDSRSSVPVDHRGETHSHSQVRRFDVKTFAFLDGGQPSVEEIFFYCWVEICTEEVACAQSCALSSEGARPRREASSEPPDLQLVSLGPLLPDQSSTGPEERSCVQHNTMHRDDRSVSEQQEVPQT